MERKSNKWQPDLSSVKRLQEPHADKYPQLLNGFAELPTAMFRIPRIPNIKHGLYLYDKGIQNTETDLYDKGIYKII